MVASLDESWFDVITLNEEVVGFNRGPVTAIVPDDASKSAPGRLTAILKNGWLIPLHVVVFLFGLALGLGLGAMFMKLLVT